MTDAFTVPVVSESNARAKELAKQVSDLMTGSLGYDFMRARSRTVGGLRIIELTFRTSVEVPA